MNKNEALEYPNLANQMEMDAIKVFQYTHRCNAKSPRNITVESVGTHIGNKLKAICPTCGKTKDITDYDCW